ncbi:MAG: leucyl aminopeptidase [Chloroflexi bacterium]|nr:leucyl aminopeptidase [Chloroflexota bacterium]MCL5076361.1 leucyl aminopeptidase [Chloroflexota bacterium]
MDITTVAQPLTEIDCDALVINVFKEETTLDESLRVLDDRLNGALARLLESGELDCELYATALLHTGGQVAPARLCLVRGHQCAELNGERVRKVAGAAARFLRKRGVQRAGFFFRSNLNPTDQAVAITEGTIIGLYEPDHHKTEGREKRTFTHLILVAPHLADVEPMQTAVERGSVLAEATNYARFLVNEPANSMTPAAMVEQARQLAQTYNLEFKAINEQEMERLGMQALLSVARGSEQPAYLIVLKYKVDNAAEETLGLIGKGLTFDSGGISLKPAEGMRAMKMDMAGAAAVLATMRAIAELQPRINVIAMVPVTENLPSGKASRPGDIVRAMNGKTIEIISTDAEGRMILADALVYAQQEGANGLVDIATLTGACVIALGTMVSGVMGRPQEWVERLFTAAEQAGEPMWQLPLVPEYIEYLESEVADFTNVGGRAAGTIQGALFLQQFVRNDVPWVHLDIAGTAYKETEKEIPYLARWATGVGVRTLANLACALAGQ